MWTCGLEVRVVEGAAMGRVYPLESTDITIGRARPGQVRSVASISIDDDTVSSRQADLRWNPGARTFTLINRSDTNPTLVNNAVARDVELRPGDRIRMGRCVLELQRVESRSRRSIPARPAAPDTPHRVRADLVASFFRRLATMMAASVQLVQALEFLQDSEEDAGLGPLLEELLNALQGGRKLSEAMRAPRMRLTFDPIMIGMISLGEKTGALLATIERLADLTESQLRLRRATIAALTYPAVLVGVICLVGLLFVVVLGNRDQGIFALFGSDLPWPTQALVTISGLLRNPLCWLTVVLGLGLPWYCLHRKMQSPSRFRMFVHTAALQVPVVGVLIKKAVSARMLYVLSNCLLVGVPMLEALKLARSVCGNDRIKERLDTSTRLFSHGTALAEAFEETRVFPPLVISMVAMGEESGSLDDIMGRVTSIYEEDVTSALENAARLIEPILLGAAGIMAGFLALATLLPIIRVVNKL